MQLGIEETGNTATRCSDLGVKFRVKEAAHLKGGKIYLVGLIVPFK